MRKRKASAAKLRAGSAALIETLKKMGAHESVTYDPETGERRKTYTISLGTRNVIPKSTTTDQEPTP